MISTVSNLRLISSDLTATSYPIAEPISAPEIFGNRLDRFGNIYNLSNNSHLFRFLVALCGDAGAGQLKKDLLLPRLEQQLEVTHFGNLDRLYGNPLGLPRLSTEIYSYNPETDFLHSAQWDEVKAKDASYRARCLTWMRAILAGPTPYGIRLAAEAAIGVDCDVWERYQYVQYPGGTISQDYSKTSGVNEFVVIPRVPGEALTQKDKRTLSRLIDIIKPVNTIGTVWVDGDAHGNIARLQRLPALTAASSEWFNIQRFVTGRGDIAWPARDVSQGWWIDTAEREAPTLAFMNRQESATYLTIISSSASTYQVGFFNQEQRALFSHLQDANGDFPPSASYDNAIAPVNVSTGFNANGLVSRNIVINQSYPIGYFAEIDSNLTEPVAQSFWASREAQADVEDYLQLELGRPRPVNYIYFEICQKPIDWTIEWRDKDGNWDEIPLRDDYPPTMASAYLPSMSNPWVERDVYFETVEATAIRINFTRRNDPFPLITSLPFEYSIEIRDIHLIHTVPAADDFIADTGVDILGNQFRTAIQTYSASNTVNGETAPWYSQPNPSKFAVEALYYDLGDEVIDEIYIDPITYGPDMHFYYSDEESDLGSSYMRTILSDLPKAYWRCEETSGNLFDSSGNNHPAVPAGTITYGTSAIGSGLTLLGPPDNVKSHLNVADHADLDLGNTFTLECWLAPAALAFPAAIIDKGVGAYQITLLVDYRFQLQARDGDWAAISSMAIPTDGKLHHIVATKNGTSDDVHLYLDGVEVTGSVQSVNLTNTSNELRIGATTGSTNGFNHYPGVIDEIAIYSTVLTASQVAAHYDAYAASLSPDWDNKLWTPIPRNYILKKGYHALPRPTKIKFFKIEFSNLTAIPYEPIQFPRIVPTTFRRYPIWINNYFNSLHPVTVEDTIQQRNAIQIDPLEIGFKTVGDSHVSNYEAERIHQTTSTEPEITTFINDILNQSQKISVPQQIIESQIQYRPPIMWQSNLIANLDSTRALSRVALEPHNGNTKDTGWNAELTLPSTIVPTSTSSTDMTKPIQEKVYPIMFFSRRCRHQYQIVSAPIDRKIAYIVGINSVGFYRRDTTWRQDDRLYIETLDDTEFAEINDFVQSDWRWTVD